MNGAIGETLPLALGIAISPIAIIAVILMLLSPKAKGTSLGFLLGWLMGIVVALVIFILLAGLIPHNDPNAAKPIAGTVKVILGVMLLLLAIRQWRQRPKEGKAEKLPTWMGAIDSMTAGRGFLLAFLLAAVNPKNLLLAASAGVTIGTTAAGPGGMIVALIIFAIIAACTVAIPVIAYLSASERMRGPLESLRVWLVKHNAAVMSVVLAILSFAVIGKGIANF